MARTQSYFGEHGDDIICSAVYEPAEVYDAANPAPWGGGVLMATGEIGKKPAIHLYCWTPSDGAEVAGVFTSLVCMQGYHMKGVAQLAFSGNGESQHCH